MIINNKTIAELAAKIKAVSLETFEKTDAIDLGNDCRLIKCFISNEVYYSLYIGTKFVMDLWPHSFELSVECIQQDILNGLKSYIFKEAGLHTKEFCLYLSGIWEKFQFANTVTKFDNITVKINKIFDVDLYVIKVYDDFTETGKESFSFPIELFQGMSKEQFDDVFKKLAPCMLSVYHTRVLNGILKYELV